MTTTTKTILIFPMTMKNTKRLFLIVLQHSKMLSPLKHRHHMSSSVSMLSVRTKTSATFVGKGTWAITTSMSLLVLPLGLEIEKEQACVAYEKAAMQ
ncbi:hypothetical protein K501DRAFT_305869 [Backusella circina FSU 941]|nr:hypothetical protein K501DRAFT_305869 [Backusella circina FSU 941]